MTKRIIVLEGAAGSGKSTIIQKSVGMVRGSTQVSSSITDITKSRLPDDRFAMPQISLVNDVNKICEAILSPADVVFIDRLMLSQLVYQQIRNHKPDESFNPQTYGYFHHLTLGMTNLFKLVYQQLSVRSLHSSPIDDYIVSLVILSHAGYSKLETFRATSLKEYPAGEADYQLYHELIQRVPPIHRQEPNSIKVHVIDPMTNNLSIFDAVIEAEERLI